MKYLQFILLLSAIFIAGSFSEASAQYDEKNSKQAENTPTASLADVRVHEIERKAYKQLIKLPFYGVFDHIAFKVDDDTVTLLGKVAVARNKKDAERAVKRVAGVNRVVNRIEVLPPSSFDNRIRLRTLRTLARSGLFRYFQEPNPSVRIIVDGGRLALEGQVANRGDFNLMNVLANGISDVFSVKNNLIVENGGAR